MQHKKIIFIVATFASALGQVTSDLYLPSLPAISQGLNTTDHIAQLTIATYMIGFSLSQLVYGPLSDGIGRRKPLLFGLVLCLIGGVICLTAQNIETVIVGRLLQGVGAGACGALFRPIFSDLFSGEKLAKYGSYAALVGIWFLAIGPVFGGYIQHYMNWRMNFVVLVTASLIALFAVMLVLPETNIHLHPSNLRVSKIKKNLIALLTSPTFLGYNFCSLLTYGAITAWLTAGTIVLQ